MSTDNKSLSTEFSSEIMDHFSTVPDIAKPLLNGAKEAFSRLEQMMYTAPAFVNLVKANIPAQALQAVLTEEQEAKIASGALKLMTKKDGSLMANLVDPNTKKIVSTISLQNIDLTPALSQAATSFAAQMQMAQIAEEIQKVQVAIEEVRQGQEDDRLATAYSCQQKLLQALTIKNPELRAIMLLRIASDAEDSRNLLMLSQKENVAFIKNQPESLIGKILSGATPEKIDARINEIRDGLSAINMVSLVEAMAYQEMGESAAARQSLDYYAAYIQTTYLDSGGFVERLDLIDPSPENYWSKILPDIKKKISVLPCVNTIMLTGGEENGIRTESMQKQEL